MIFPINIIYVNTIYYRIYDSFEFRNIEIFVELYENTLLLGFLIYSLFFNSFTVIALVTIIFVLVIQLYFIVALFYYMFIYDEYIRKKVKKVGNKEYSESLSSDRGLVEDPNSIYPLNNQINIYELDTVSDGVIPRVSAPLKRPDINLTEADLNYDKYDTQRITLNTDTDLI